MTHPSRKKLAGSVFTMGYAMFLVQFGSVSTVYCLRCLFRCCRYMLFLLLTGLFLLLAPFSLKQPNPVFADCRHLLHQNLNISWKTSRNASLEITWSEAKASISSFCSLLRRTPVVFAKEGARAQWRGVAAPSSGDLESGWSWEIWECIWWTCAWTTGDCLPPGCLICSCSAQCAWTVGFGFESQETSFTFQFGCHRDPDRLHKPWSRGWTQSAKLWSNPWTLPCPRETPSTATGLQGYWQAGSEKTSVKDT